MYVIQRTDQGGGFVSMPGSTKYSYTHDLRKARVFPTKEAAEHDKCPENETVVSVDSLLTIG